MCTAACLPYNQQDIRNIIRALAGVWRYEVNAEKVAAQTPLLRERLENECAEALLRALTGPESPLDVDTVVEPLVLAATAVDGAQLRQIAAGAALLDPVRDAAALTEIAQQHVTRTVPALLRMIEQQTREAAFADWRAIVDAPDSAELLVPPRQTREEAADAAARHLLDDMTAGLRAWTHFEKCVIESVFVPAQPVPSLGPQHLAQACRSTLR